MFSISYFMMWIFCPQRNAQKQRFRLELCSVVTVTFTSRDIENHVLARVRHLVNRIVVFWSIVCFLLLQSYYKLVLEKMANAFSYDAALGYKECSASVQKVEGELFIQSDVCPEAGDAILDLGCGTGELSAYLADLVGTEGKVVAVDPDKERIRVAQKSYDEVKNLSILEGSSSNFPGIGSESYDIIFSNHVIHWIPDKLEVFKNMFESVKGGGKIAVQYLDHLPLFLLTAFKELNPENAERIISKMFLCEDKGKMENYCLKVGFQNMKSFFTGRPVLVFGSIESLLKWLSTSTHGVFDPELVSEERLKKFYPYSSRDGEPPFDLQAGFKEESFIARLIAVKPTEQ